MVVAVVDSDMTDAARPLRLGFPVKVMGKPGLKSNDTRRWQKGPHLKCSLEEVDRILDHLKAHDLNMYRLSSDLGSGLIGHSQKMTVAARATAEKKTVGHRS